MDHFAKTLLSAYRPWEAAEALGVTEKTVRNLIARGELRAYKQKKPGRKAYTVIPGWAIICYQDEEAKRIVRSFLDGSAPQLREAKALCESGKVVRSRVCD